MMVTKKFWRQGEPFVWATSLALSLILFMTFLLFYVVLVGTPVRFHKFIKN